MIVAAVKEVDQRAATVIDAGEGTILLDGPRHRVACDPEVGLHIAQQLEWILPRSIALVDEGEDRGAAALAHLEKLASALFDTLAVVEQHHRAVGGNERSVGVLGEILVAGRVEEVDLVSLVLELHHAGCDRDTAFLLQLHPVRCRVACCATRLHRPREMDRSAVQEELFRQRGFPRIGVADDGERPPAADEGFQLRLGMHDCS